jgi:hypothetical protein
VNTKRLDIKKEFSVLLASFFPRLPERGILFLNDIKGGSEWEFFESSILWFHRDVHTIKYDYRGKGIKSDF